MSYASDSAADRLAAVRAAIVKILNAQEYGTGTRRTRYAELKQLREMEKDLQKEVEQSGGGFTVGQIDSPG